MKKRKQIDKESDSEMKDMNSYDSAKDTLEHIRRVSQIISKMNMELMSRANCHDSSKLKSPEKETFDVFTPKLKGSTYGSEEYKGFLKEMNVALKNHYEMNHHHPEHYTNGVEGMDLIDLVEMLCDWKAATERHANGDINKSILINKDRFGISDQLVSVLQNTVKRYF